MTTELMEATASERTPFVKDARAAFFTIVEVACIIVHICLADSSSNVTFLTISWIQRVVFLAMIRKSRCWISAIRNHLAPILGLV